MVFKLFFAIGIQVGIQSIKYKKIHFIEQFPLGLVYQVRKSSNLCHSFSNLNIMKKLITLVLVASLAACNQPTEKATMTDKDKHAETMMVPEINKAVCVLYPTEGSTVTGLVTFTKTPEGIKVVADVEGLTPGQHGFHIHQYGDCSAPDATSAGGHFNPQGMKHGGPTDMERHEGDFGNLEANDQGVAHLEMIDKHLSFHGESSIIGRGMIVHADPDDLVSQPTGNAGARVACGAISVAK
jgi:Cu-Zn family superoxide dismutase